MSSFPTVPLDEISIWDCETPSAVNGYSFPIVNCCQYFSFFLISRTFHPLQQIMKERFNAEREDSDSTPPIEREKRGERSRKTK